MREKINYRISIIAILTGAIEQAFNKLITEQARLGLPDGTLEDLWTNACVRVSCGPAPRLWVSPVLPPKEGFAMLRFAAKESAA